jgi:hypothetical protein
VLHFLFRKGTSLLISELGSVVGYLRAAFHILRQCEFQTQAVEGEEDWLELLDV